MGVDLTLLPVAYIANGHATSFEVLNVDRDDDLFDALKAASSLRPEFALSSHYGTVPDGSWRHERGFGPTTEDSYGQPIRYLTAKQLADFLAGRELSRRSRAVAAYLGCLEPNQLVALYWH